MVTVRGTKMIVMFALCVVETGEPLLVVEEESAYIPTIEPCSPSIASKGPNLLRYG